MKLHHLKIDSPTGIGQATTVELDGEPTHFLSGITLKIESTEFVTAELRMVLAAPEFNGLAQITLPQESVDLLLKLGWTPPAEEETE